MPKLAGHRNVAAATMSALSAVLLATSVALLSACSSPQHASTVPGTTPAVWTGAPAPAGTSDTEGGAAGGDLGQTVITHLKAPDGTQVATAKFDFSNGYRHRHDRDDRCRCARARLPRSAHPQGGQV